MQHSLLMLLNLASAMDRCEEIASELEHIESQGVVAFDALNNCSIFVNLCPSSEIILNHNGSSSKLYVACVWYVN